MRLKGSSTYQTCIKRVLSEYQVFTTPCSTVELIFDDEHRHYMAFRVGWLKHKRIHFCLVHIDICDDTVVIQANNTEDIIDEELIEQGIPKDKFVLDYYLLMFAPILPKLTMNNTVPFTHRLLLHKNMSNRSHTVRFSQQAKRNQGST